MSHNLALRILATSDLHAHLAAFDYATDRASDVVGFARTAALIRAARAECPNTLVFDCGDLLQGTVLGELARKAPPGGIPVGAREAAAAHPMIAAMNLIGYDGATLGNHDFDFGYDFACEAYAASRFPVVASNLVPSGPQGRDLFQPTVLLERHFPDSSGRAVGVRIGLVGLLPPQTAEWGRDKLDGKVTILDMADTARRAAADLRKQGADIVIALAHTGFPRPDVSDAAENAAIVIAGTGAIDVLLLGHTHRVFPDPGAPPLPGVDALRGTVAGRPAAMPGLFGSHLGVVDLLLTGEEGAWRIAGYEVEARPIARRSEQRAIAALTADDPVIGALAAPFHAAARAHTASLIGRTRHPLHTYFALVRNSAAMALLAEAQEWWASARLAGTPLAGLPVVSAVSPLKAGGRAGPLQYSDVPAGELRLRHVDDLYPFPNTFCAIRVSGAELRDFLDQSAMVFRTVMPGAEEQLLFDEDVPSYVFDILHGLTYEFDVTRPPRDPKVNRSAPSRVVGLRHNGRPVAADDRFTLLSNSHRLSGPEFHGRTGDCAMLRTDDSSRDILRAFIAKVPAIAPVSQPTWDFAPTGGTPVVFVTGPGAEQHMGTADAPDARPVGFSPGGFVRYRMVI